jgi:hypothetical protein
VADVVFKNLKDWEHDLHARGAFSCCCCWKKISKTKKILKMQQDRTTYQMSVI